MQEIKKPMGLGEILDQTFQLVKKHFVPFSIVLLILTGPYYLFGLLASFLGGTAIFQQSFTSSGNIVKDIINRFSGQGVGLPSFHLNAGMITFAVISGILSIILIPMAKASLIIATGQLQENEQLNIKKIIKRAFSRFWPLLGSTMVFGLCITGILVVAFLFLFLIPAVPPLGIFIIIILFIAIMLFLIYLSIRWNFYFPAVIFDKVAPGLGKSWQLTKGNFWRLVGVLIVLYLITSIISNVINLFITMILGASILSSFISDLVKIFSDMIAYVGIAVVYFDLCIRNESKDLLDLIENYEDDENKNTVD